MTKQTAINGLVQWWSGQEPEIQLMTVGSLPASEDLLLVIAKRLKRDMRDSTVGDVEQPKTLGQSPASTTQHGRGQRQEPIVGRKGKDHH